MQSPKFNLRDKVWYSVVGTIDGIKVSQLMEFYIAGINISSDGNGQTYVYNLCQSLPEAYYPGNGFKNNVPEKDLS